MEAGRYIEVSASVRRQVREDLGISEPTMVAALSYKRGGEQSSRARELVLERGGVKMMYLPESEAIHDAEGYMRQIFDNGYLIVVDKASGRYRVYENSNEVEGKEVLSGKISNLSMLSKIQSLVANL